LRLIDGGACLVADDQVVVDARGGRLLARAPSALRGLIEIRGIGICAVEAAAEAPVSLVVDLVPDRAVERLPEPEAETIEGITIRRLALHAFHASTPAKIRFAASRLAVGDLPPLPQDLAPA
jgi:serine kinase of HPr protein (carbohydrate metabolism regulator)